MIKGFLFFLIKISGILKKEEKKETIKGKDIIKKRGKCLLDLKAKNKKKIESNICQKLIFLFLNK